MHISIAIPVYNEALILSDNVTRVVSFCKNNLTDVSWSIVIADNCSTDGTAKIGKELAATYPAVTYLHIAQKGKGRGIRFAWQSIDADMYCFMDADLATDLSALVAAIAAIQAGSDLAIASRYHAESKVRRSWVRRIISRGYQLVLKVVFGLRLNDAPCGFKVVTKRVRDTVVPQVLNDEWFFDSELVIIAEKRQLRITEIPVVWVEPRTSRDQSRVNIVAVCANYLHQVIALKKRIKQL